MCFYYIFKIKKFFDRFYYNYNYNFTSFVDMIDYQYIEYIDNLNIFSPKKDLRLIYVKANRFLSKMILIVKPFKSSNYVS